MNWLVDLLIFLLLVYGVYSGMQRGLVALAGSLVALIGGVVAAAAGFRWLGGLLTQWFHAFPSVANVAAYILILLLVDLVILLLIRKVARPLNIALNRRLNQAGGAVLGGIQMALWLALALSVAASFPALAPVDSSAVARPLKTVGDRLAHLLEVLPGPDFQQTLNLLTVNPESKESIPLGFTVTNGQVDPAAEENLLTLLNNERQSRGLTPLTMNQKARAVARAHSRDMFARGYFSHVTPEGVDPFQRMQAAGIQFNAAGENIALAPTLPEAHTGLMNSPPHRANILSPNYHTVGIGIVDGGPYGLMVTQDFTD